MSMDERADEIDGSNRAQIRKVTVQSENHASRRQLLRQMAGVSLGLPLTQWKALPVLVPATALQQADGRHRDPAPVPTQAVFSQEDEQFLDDLEHKTFLFFWEQANPQTGLIKDRCNVRAEDTSIVASIASVGFGLTAICIAEKRGFVSYEDARLRVLATLDFLWKKLPTHRGFFFHFANINTGERVWDSEVSSIDTAVLLCALLTCRQHFRDRDIIHLARAIFDRVDWTWLSEDITVLPMGWTPEFGFLSSKWEYYSELMMIYLLGMGSSSSRLRSSAWMEWN